MHGLLPGIAARTRDAFSQVIAVSLEPVPLTYDGRLDEATAVSERLLVLAEELGVPEMGRGFAGRPNRARYLLGRYEDVLRYARGGDAGLEISSMAAAGQVEDARKALASAMPRTTSAGAAVMLLGAAVALGDADSASAIIASLPPDFGPVGSTNTFQTCYYRTIGEAHAFLGHPKESLDYYQRAQAFCEAVRFRPELALTRLGLAELLLEHYLDERDTAIEHLDFAIREFQEMKMQPSLERALRHRGLLKA
jgi:hypothetical protein